MLNATTHILIKVFSGIKSSERFIDKCTIALKMTSHRTTLLSYQYSDHKIISSGFSAPVLDTSNNRIYSGIFYDSIIKLLL